MSKRPPTAGLAISEGVDERTADDGRGYYSFRSRQPGCGSWDAERSDEPDALADQVDDFIAYLRDERGLSASSLHARRWHVERFLQTSFASKGSIAQVTAEDIDGFLSLKGKQGWCRVSVATSVTALRSFFRYAEVRNKSSLNAISLAIPSIATATRSACSFHLPQRSKTVDRLAVVDLSADIVRRFLADLESARSCKIATRNQRLAAIRAFAGFVAEHNPVHIEWCGQIRSIPIKKAGKAVVPYLEKVEMDALLAAPDRRTAQGRRDYGLMLFLYNSGARATEAAQLKVSDLDIRTACAKITGKGGKQRLCPLWPATITELDALIGGRAAAEPVFVNRLGHPITRFHTLSSVIP